jgi:hypothetical protein
MSSSGLADPNFGYDLLNPWGRGMSRGETQRCVLRNGEEGKWLLQKRLGQFGVGDGGGISDALAELARQTIDGEAAQYD